MTDRDVMERVGSLLERAVIAIEPDEEWYKTAFAVTVRGLAAVRLMVKTRPALGAFRQAQIDAALHDWGTSRVRWDYEGIACAAGGCAREAVTQGLCKSHYNRWYKANRRGSSAAFQPRPLSRADVLQEPQSHSITPDCGVSWLAGLLEGEGSFWRAFSRGHAYPVVKLEMCSKDVVERAAALIGVTTVREQKPRDPAWSATHIAQVSGAAAATWMQRLRPLMGERRRSAIDLALDDYYPERLPVAPAHCVVPGCEGPPRGRGLCHKHYMSWSRDRAKGRVPRVKPLRSN